MPHKFKLNDLVRFAALGGPRVADGQEVYEVIRLTPVDQSGEATYRIRRAGGDAPGPRAGMPPERAVRESEIAPGMPRR